MALGLTLTIGAKVFNLLEIGKYRLNTSTTDQPEDLSIQSSLNPQGQSSFVVKSTRNFNSATAGLPDEVSQVHVVMKYSSTITRSQLQNQFTDLKTLLSDANVDALMRGER